MSVGTGSASSARRLVGQLRVHGPAIDFRALCQRVVPEDARYLVLDLDRTTHLGWNMGELLGWELSAASAYGEAHLARVESRRAPGRFLLDWSDPAGVLRYLRTAAGVWAKPGLNYLVWGKLASKNLWGRALQYARFGSEPVQVVQQTPQMVLLSQMAGHTLAELESHARRVWHRHRADQVIERADLEWLRARCPDLTVVLSSASPTPVVNAAAAELGIDHAVGTSIAEYEEALCVPFRMPGSADPRRIAPPSAVTINSGPRKIDALRQRFPDMFADAALCVGMTDTGYGEDHSWAQHFDVVVDVNSSDPFPPIVDATSPIREVHSAALLTRRERERRAAGEHWSDPRRASLPQSMSMTLDAAQLAALLSSELQVLEQLESARREAEQLTRQEAHALRAEIDRLLAEMEHAIVAARTESPDAAAPTKLHDLLGVEGALRRRLAQVERPISAVSRRIHDTLMNSRRMLQAAALAPATA